MKICDVIRADFRSNRFENYYSTGKILAKRILITGINGFAGRYCAQMFNDAGYEVFGTCQNMSSIDQHNKAHLFKADISKLSEIRAVVKEVSPNYILHLASISFVGHENVDEIYLANFIGTRNLLQAISELDVVPIATLLASSANVYGNSTRGILDEATPLCPMNDYGVSKAAMELLVPQFKSRLNVIIARLFNFTGVGQSENFLIPKIVKHFKDKAPTIELGNIDVERDFNDVRDTICAIKGLLENSICYGETFNICSGKPTSLGQIIEYCSEISGHKIDVSINPKFVRPNEVRTLIGDATKISTAIDYSPKYGLHDTIKWMLSSQ